MWDPPRTVDREHSRTRKCLQLEHDKLAHAESALQFWRDHQSFFIWDPIPIFVRQADYRDALNWH